LALGLVLSVAGCATKASPPPPEPAAPAESTVVNPEALKPTEPVVQAPGAEAQDADLRVKGIKLVQDEGQSGLFVKLSRIPDKVEHFTLSKPNRLVIDVRGPVASDLKAIERTATDDPRVSRVRAAQQDGRLRITVDLKGPAPKYTVNDLKTMVVAFLGERSGSPSPARSEVLYAEGGEPTAIAQGGGPRYAAARRSEKSEGPESSAPSPGSPRVDAFDVTVVARVHRRGRVPCGRAREWMICGKSSAWMTGAGARSFSVAGATAVTTTAPTVGTTPLVLPGATRRRGSTGGSFRRGRRPLHARSAGVGGNAK